MSAALSFNPTPNLYKRIHHGLSWRRSSVSSKIRSYLRPLGAQIAVALRWHAGIRAKPHGLPHDLVISLTSYPQRFNTLHLTLRSLLRQSMKSDHLILWVAHDDISLLPKNVIDLLDSGLEIRATNDIKSYKKILPTLDVFPNAFICTADDDLYYWPSWLEELVEAIRAKEHVIVCHRAREIVLGTKGKISPYNQWVMNTDLRGQSSHLFPTSGGGAIFPPGVLVHTVEDRLAAMELCPQADDIWLYWISRLNGANYCTTKHHREIISWLGSQKQALWHKNLLQNQNDEQIKKMVEKYGIP